MTPVSRAAALVRDREHYDAFVTDEIRDEVREPRHWDPSHFKILRDILDQGSDPRPTLDRLDRAVERCEEDKPETISPFLIPQRSIVDLADGLVDEADLGPHPPSVSASRCRTVVQS